MCNCKNIEPQSVECYEQQIVVTIPKHMGKYRTDRRDNGLSESICLDPCIVSEIKELWKAGIITYGSCCGHNKREPMVNVDESNVEQMLSMGYIQNHPDKTRKDTFKLKTN